MTASINKTKGYHRLRIIGETKQLIKITYHVTESFPKSELFGLTSQLRRAVVSVLLNIVEGDRRHSNKEYYKFLNIAEASLAEVEVILELVQELKFLNPKQYKQSNTKENKSPTCYPD